MNAPQYQFENKETGEIIMFATEAQYIANRDLALVNWQAAQAVLESAKNVEMQNRKYAVLLMHDPNKTGSTENVELGNGYKAKMKVPINYGFVKDLAGKLDKKRIDFVLSKIEATGSAGELIAERLISWTPKLSLTEYNQTAPEIKAIIDEVIVTSEGTPTLEIVAPKGK